MEETTTEEAVEKYEASVDFDNLYFGILERASPRRPIEIEEIAAKSSSIPAFISGVIKDGLGAVEKVKSPLFDHYMGYDEAAWQNYLRAEVRLKSLDKGEDSSEKIRQSTEFYALPEDRVMQLIPKELGGHDGYSNAFPLHPAANVTAWKDALEKVYEYVKMGEGRIVRLIYILGHKLGEFRNSDIFFNFAFYSNYGRQLDNTIEGKVHNPTKYKS